MPNHSAETSRRRHVVLMSAINGANRFPAAGLNTGQHPCKCFRLRVFSVGNKTVHNIPTAFLLCCVLSWQYFLCKKKQTTLMNWGYFMVKQEGDKNKNVKAVTSNNRVVYWHMILWRQFLSLLVLHIVLFPSFETSNRVLSALFVKWSLLFSWPWFLTCLSENVNFKHCIWHLYEV